MITLGNKTLSAFIFYGMTYDKKAFQKAYELWDQGMLELCGEAVGYADLMEDAFDTLSEKLDVPGVYDYDVAEVFGKWFRDQVIELNGNVPDTKTCIAYIHQLVECFFSCGGQWDPELARELTANYFNEVHPCYFNEVHP